MSIDWLCSSSLMYMCPRPYTKDHTLFTLQQFQRVQAQLNQEFLHSLLALTAHCCCVMTQVIALMALSLAHLLFLRFIEPMCERGELVVALVGEVCDAGVFVCGLILIIGDSVNDRFRSVAAVLYGHANLKICLMLTLTLTLTLMLMLMLMMKLGMFNGCNLFVGIA